MGMASKRNRLLTVGTDARRQVIVERGPSSKPYAKIIIKQKRMRSEDRRKMNTFLATDRRCGIADRRQQR